jgi:hypothetical protein
VISTECWIFYRKGALWANETEKNPPGCCSVLISNPLEDQPLVARIGTEKSRYLSKEIGFEHDAMIQFKEDTLSDNNFDISI